MLLSLSMFLETFRPSGLPKLLFVFLSCQLFLAAAFPTIPVAQDLAQAVQRVSAISERSAAEETIKRQEERRSLTKDEVTSPLKRGYAMEPLGNGWEVFYEYFDTLLPKQMVAPILSKFYGDLMMEILGFAEKDPLSHIVLQQGALRLQFWSATGETIPWNVLYRFASNLLTITNLGFTSTYDAVYLHKYSDTKIFVQLSLVVDALAGLSSPGPSSGSSN